MNPSPSSPTPARAWLVVGLLFFVGGLNYLDRSLLAVMRSSVMEEIPMTEAQFGLLLGVYAWITALLSPFLGYLADRFNRSAVIIGSLLIWSVITALTAHAVTYEQLLACRIALAISEACYLPAALALITDYHRGPTRSRATSVHIVGLSLGAAISGVGGMLATRFSWHMPYSFFGLVGIALTAVIAFPLRDPPRAPSEAKADTQVRFGPALVSLFGYSSFIIVFIYFGLAAFATGGINSWMPTYLKEEFHLTQGAAGMSATGYFNIAGVIGMLLGGFWADRWSRTNPRGRILSAFVGKILAAPCVLLMALSSSLSVALFGLAAFGLSYMIAGVQTMPILCQVTDPRYRSTAYGVLNFLAGTLAGVATYVCGALRDANIDFKWYLFFSAASLVVCALLLLRIKPLPQTDL